MSTAVYKWQREDHVMLVCAGPGTMPDDIWAKYISDFTAWPVTRVLGLNLGTLSMTSVQRKQASDTTKSKGVAPVVVTDDRITRGLITAMSWLGADIKAFPWTEISAAIRALGLDTDLERRVTSKAQELRAACEREIELAAKKK